MGPAQQRFDPDDAASLGGDDRLIVDVERLQRDRGFELAQEEPPLRALGFDLRRKASRRTATLALGGAQGKVGAARQFLAGRTILRRLRDADAGGNLPHAVHEDRTQERSANAVCEHARRAGVVAAHDDGEFILFEAPEQRAGRQTGLQMFGNVHEHRVAAGPSQHVVDLVKTVEIDEHEGNDAGITLGQHPIERLEHHTVIGQAGQRVLAGQLAHHLGAAIERAGQPLRGARGEEGAQRERDTDRPYQPP